MKTRIVLASLLLAALAAPALTQEPAGAEQDLQCRVKTGGEPLVRKNMSLLAGKLARIPGLLDLSLSTNAVGLARQADKLKSAGISRINISLDTLRDDRFKAMTRIFFSFA